MIVGNFLVGSQNYQLDLPQSDRDYYMISPPSFYQLFFNEKVHRKADEHTTLADVRDFCRRILKGNPNYWEMLYSVDKTYYNAAFEEMCSIARVYSGAILRYNWTAFTQGSYSKVLTGIKKELTAKTASRFLYFYEMNKRLCATCGDMSNESWRGDWTERYKDIRFSNTITYTIEKEIEKAKENWNFDMRTYATDKDGVLAVQKKYIELFKEGMDAAWK